MVLRLRAAAAGVQNLGSHLDFRKIGVRIPKVVYDGSTKVGRIGWKNKTMSIASPYSYFQNEVANHESYYSVRRSLAEDLLFG